MSEPDLHEPGTPPDVATTSTSSPRRFWRRWTSEWYYLGYLSMLLFQPAFDPGSGAFEWIVTGVAVTAFVPLFVHVYGAQASRLQRLAAPLAVLLALALFRINGGATVLLVYAAAFVASTRPREVALRWFAGLSVLSILMGVLAPIPLAFALMVFSLPVFFIWVVGLSSLADVERERQSQRLRIDNARIGHLATAAERERIARDLHDVVGQSLTEVIVRAQLVRRLSASDPEAGAREAAEIERAARTTLDEVRAVVRGWREVRLDEELETARRGLAAARIELRVDRDPDFDPAPTTETTLALVVREAVTNVIRHADASTCAIVLQRRDNHDVVEVADDGRGTVDEEGAGLLGMRERILALGGEFRHTDTDGVTVTALVPAGLPA